MKIINTPAEFLAALERAAHPNQADYLALYASWAQGIILHPPWMVVALDDHMVHRGDGVFDVAKCVDGHLYLWDEHEARFRRSAQALGIAPPPELDRLEELTKELIRLVGRRDCVIHLYLSRGPGGLGVHPTECVGSQLMILVSGLHEPSAEVVERGARAVTGKTPAKPAWMAKIKSVDYLQNVLLQGEAVAAGANYALAFDPAGRLTEGATVSIAAVTQDKALLFPRAAEVFPGITRVKIIDLAQELVADGTLSRVGEADLGREDLLGAAEVLVMATVTNLVALVELDGQPLGGGQPGPVHRRLLAALRRDVLTNPGCRKAVF